MKTFITSVLAAYVSATEVQFMEHISLQGKSYDSIEEFNLRKAAWETTDEKIREFRAK